jgi:tetratricopeptide (TPR) repeat protein
MSKYFLFCLFFAFFSLPIIAQENAFEVAFKSKLSKEVSLFENPLLNKVHFFYLNDQIDSTLFYSSKYLNAKKSKSQTDNFFYFFRGHSFKEKELYDEANKNFLMISRDFVFYKSVFYHLGQIAFEQNRIDDAMNYFKTIENIDIYNYYNINKGNLIMNLGMCFFLQNKLDLAESYLTQSTKIHGATKDTRAMIATYSNLANLYYEQYLDEKAIGFFQKAYDLAQKTNYVKEKYSTALNMAVIEENRKNYKKAVDYRKEAGIWKDSLNDQNKIWNIAQLEKKFAVNEKEKEIQLLEVKNEARRTQRNGLFIIASLLILTLGISLYFYRMKVKRNQVIQAQKEDLDALNATKDKLFSIVSHDLRSSVNALKSSNNKLMECLENKNYEALDGLLHKNSAIANGSYNLLDNLLNWANQQTNQIYFEKESLHLKTVVNHVE